MRCTRGPSLSPLYVRLLSTPSESREAWREGVLGRERVPTYGGHSVVVISLESTVVFRYE